MDKPYPSDPALQPTPGTAGTNVRVELDELEEAIDSGTSGPPLEGEFPAVDASLTIFSVESAPDEYPFSMVVDNGGGFRNMNTNFYGTPTLGRDGSWSYTAVEGGDDNGQAELVAQGPGGEGVATRASIDAYAEATYGYVEFGANTFNGGVEPARVLIEKDDATRHARVQAGNARIDINDDGVGGQTAQFHGVAQSITGATTQDQVDSVVALLVSFGFATDDR